MTDAVPRRLGDTYVVVPSGSDVEVASGLFEVNQTGLDVWERIGSESTDLDDLVSDMLLEWDVDRQTLRRDVVAFLRAAADFGLVEMMSDSAGA